MENFDELNLKHDLQEYIDKNFLEEIDESFSEVEEKFSKIEEPKFIEEDEFFEESIKTSYSARIVRSEKFSKVKYSERPHKIFADTVDKTDFKKIFDEEAEETFSEKLIRLIAESGEKNSVIYNRANIDRRHFSKICNHRNYQPSKLTAVAFAIALKLDFDETQELLAAAGYTLTKNNLADVIISFFIERNFFDVDKINQYLYEYEQPLLGG